MVTRATTGLLYERRLVCTQRDNGAAAIRLERKPATAVILTAKIMHPRRLALGACGDDDDAASAD